MDDVVSTNLIRRKSRAVVLELQEDGIPVRRIVPSEVIIDDNGVVATVRRSDFDEGIEYGIPFSDLLKEFSIPVESISNELHKSGLWTAEDIVKNPAVVQSAILSASRAILADVVQIAKSFSRKEI